MNRDVALLILVLLLGLAAFGMWRGWRSKQHADIDLPALNTEQLAIGDIRLTIPSKYVATTHADDPSDRVIANGLAMRGNGALSIGSLGIWIDRDGEVSFAIPFTTVTNISPRSWAIDRGSDHNGLIGIDWMLGTAHLTTFIRSDRAHDASMFYDDVPADKRNVNTAMTATKERS